MAKQLGDAPAEALKRMWDQLNLEARTRVAAEVFNDLPDQLESLYHFCVEVTRLLYDAERQRRQHPDPVRVGALANNLGTRLGALKHFTEAHEKAQEAVRIYRNLAELHPNTCEPFLAGSLANLATILGGLGYLEEALDKAEEAVTIYRKLAGRHPDALRPYLAGSLSNVAKFLGELGRYEEALLRSEEAVRLLAPYFLRLPEAYGGRIAPIVQQYQALYQSFGREPDVELLAPILRKLEELKNSRSGDRPNDPA